MSCIKCGSSTGPQFYGLPHGKVLDGPFCGPCWGPYFWAHREELTLAKGGTQALFVRKGLTE